MPWNPGLSYEYATHGDGASTTFRLVGDGTLETTTVTGRPCVRIRWTGDLPVPLSNVLRTPVSFWYRGAAFRSILPLTYTEQPGGVWAQVPTDVSSPGATARDVLLDNKWSAAGWAADTLARPNHPAQGRPPERDRACRTMRQGYPHTGEVLYPRIGGTGWTLLNVSRSTPSSLPAWPSCTVTGRRPSRWCR
jgi:hypothetical protein